MFPSSNFHRTLDQRKKPGHVRREKNMTRESLLLLPKGVQQPVIIKKSTQTYLEDPAKRKKNSNLNQESTIAIS